MNIEILDQSFDLIKVLDEYESFIWTDRYNTPGDFELYTPATDDILQAIARDNYVKIEKSDKLMIIEDIAYQSSTQDSGRVIKATGRSLESILDRRIVWGKKNMSGELEFCTHQLLAENIMEPSDSKRRIPNFFFKPASTSIGGISINMQFNGDTLLSIIENITTLYDIGWRITLNDQKQFEFQYYVGKDRSYQGINTPVVFSPEYENVINSTYTVVNSNYKTVALVEGDTSNLSAEASGENVTLTTESTPIYVTTSRGKDPGSGLSRREHYINGSSVEKNEDMSLAEYEEKLSQYGDEELTNYTIVKKFDGQYETKLIYEYGKDFFIGDVVEVADEFGNSASSKITEYIWSSNINNGEESYPTFRPTETTE